ncbi:MAG: hypothetical protein HC919_03215 [Oscillatoriales cyanobacterium SM2_2_1]|nr:hypothetical protein [Oscillatoriales cyanobacterium SM2_2_1]
MHPSDREPIRKLSRGITLLFYSLEIYAFSFLCLLIFPFLLRQLVIIPPLAILLAFILSVMGKIYCLGCPNRVPGKVMIQVAVVLEAISIGLAAYTFYQFWSSLTTFVLPNPRLVNLLMTVSQLAGNGALIALIIFLKGTADFQRSRPLADQASTLLLIVLFLLAAPILLLMLSPLALLISLLSLVMILVAVILLSQLLLGLKESLLLSLV